ncbi:hypothetical protein F4819DRAFT_257446 [Hypoxylon fuscum]|nr:hypothetical protein F4819DRAFT_257446 [Hypoxylon fuscum]
MMFNIKSVFFFGLVAVSTATPSSVLLPRAKIPEVLKCDGKEWTKAQILASKEKARELANSNYAYPDLFGNKDGHGQPIFGAQGQLWEFPLLDPPWTNGIEPLTFRVIMKDDYTYVGVTNKDTGTGNTVHKCVNTA